MDYLHQNISNKKRNHIVSGKVAVFSKLIILLSFFMCLSSCINVASVDIKMLDKKNAKSTFNISLANVQVINHQLVLTGTNLDTVTDFKIKDGSTTATLQIESKTNTSLIANTVANTNLTVGVIFDFILSNANASLTFQVSFVNSNNSITASMLTTMGATKGQVMKFNGLSWVASTITNAQTYMGTWDADSNAPDLSVPSTRPGDYYIVAVSGIFETVTYDVGDWIISDGYNWQKVANSAVVVSTFNGRRGAVTLTPADYVSLKNGLGKLTGSSINDIFDVNISAPINGSVLKYDSATNKWVVGADNTGAAAYSGAVNKAVITDNSGALSTSTTSAAELAFVSGVTSSIQDQLNSKLSTTLADGKILIGNATTATATSVSGDATLSSTGVLSLKSTGTAGTYYSVTTDTEGRVVSGNTTMSAITALTGDVTATGTGSVAATISSNAVNSSKISDGSILPVDLDMTGASSATSGLLMHNLTGGFTSMVCSTYGYVPTWTVTGFVCMPITAGTSLSSIAAALGTNTIDNLNFEQVWNWASATTQSLMTMAANSLTTGSILSLKTSNPSVNSSNGLLNVENSGTSVNGVLARFKSNSTANSGMTILTSGRVGIGTMAPAAPLEVNGDVKVGNSSAACSSTTKGSIRYNSTSNVLEYCNGTLWNLVQTATCTDATPATFLFSDQANAAVSTLITSNIIQMTGIDCRVLVKVSGVGSPALRVCTNSGCTTVIQDWTTNAASIGPNEYLQIRVTSDAAGGVTNRTTVIVGSAASAWSVTTTGDCTGTPAVGTACPDGTVYAGLTPDGSVKMYTTRCDLGQSWNGSNCTGSRMLHNWNNGSGNYFAATLFNFTTGKANSSTLYAKVDSGAPYAGATACEELNQDGYTDWYLPAVNEVFLLYNGRYVIQNFELNAGAYMTSNEADLSRMQYISFPNGTSYLGTKSNTYYVRCVRK